MLFDRETTNRTDFRNIERRKTAIVYKEKPNHVKLKDRTSPLKNVHTLTDWKGSAVPFSLTHFRKDIIRTCPSITLEEPDNRFNKEEEQVRRTRPRVVITPAVSIDDIADQHVRQTLLDDVYISTTRRAYKESKTSCQNVKASLPSRYAPSNPLALAKRAPPFVSPQWRWESAKWDRKQLRAHCEPTKEFWLRRK
ncbi:unnamed protein product [Parnassius apollo]|uniref:(apollo) hypothetical protein n=1 Tax=Parnassius apollo TaxID=110799 RepID=A0A8S3Y5S7_PARAO|nr:unnamed protein product [Parnassius apollo]